MFNDSTRLIFKTIFHTAFFQTSCPRQHKKRKNFYFERLTPKRDFSISLTISNHGWTGISKSTFTQNSYSLTYTVRLCSNEFKSCEPKYAFFAKRGHSQNSRYILTFPLPRLFKNLQPACFTNFIVFHRIAAATGLIERCKGKQHLRF